MHNKEPEDWREVLHAHITKKGLRLTQQRLLISEVFFEEVGHHTNIDELYQKIREKNSGIGYATVYRTLKLLTECGLATSMQFSDGTRRFEPVTEHHDHLICTECGKIMEFENEEIESLQDEVARQFGFSLTSHTMELYGVCDGMKTEGVCSVQ